MTLYSIQNGIGEDSGLSMIGSLRMTINLVTRCWQTSSFWFNVRHSTVTMPRSGLERDATMSRILLMTWRVSPARVGRGHSMCPPAPMIPPPKGKLLTSNFIVMAEVCQPLAARSWNSVCFAACASRWKGCGSNCVAKARIWASSKACSSLVKH